MCRYWLWVKAPQGMMHQTRNWRYCFVSISSCILEKVFQLGEFLFYIHYTQMLAPKYWSWCATNPTPQGPGTFDRDPGPVAKTESTRATPGRSSKSTTGRFERRWNVIEIFWVACICEGCLKLFDLFVILCVCSQCWNNVGRSNENESDSCPAGSLLVKAHFFLGMCDIVPYPCWVQQSDVYIFSYSAFFPSTTFPPYNIKKYSIRNQAKGHAATKFEWYPPYQVILYEICAICLIRTMLPLNFWGHWIVWPLGQTQRDVAGRSCWVNSLQPKWQEAQHQRSHGVVGSWKGWWIECVYVIICILIIVYIYIDTPQSLTWNLKLMVKKKESPFPGQDFQVPW